MKVVIGISGGVDSSVAALLLKKQGYEVIGITFKTTDNFDSNDAVETAKKLDIEHHIIDISRDFKESIIDSFINDYSNGITPNPCVYCNKKIKFKYLYEALKKYDADFLATGHYARIIDGELYKSIDKNKDQTYFLCQIDNTILSKTLFPLDGLSKEDVRKIALENNLENYNKKDSQDVCFITDSFNNFINNNLKLKKGSIVDLSTNKEIGKHNGLFYYTIGQRRGLNIGGNSSRLFVAGKDIDRNILYVTLNEEYLLSDSCLIDNVNWNGGNIRHCTAKFRYRQNETDVDIEFIDNSIKVNYNGVKNITPGQICCFYDNDKCIGGGVIKEVYKNNKKIDYL